MTVKEKILQFTIGQKIKCKLNMAEECISWFTGIISSIRFRRNNEYSILIERNEFSGAWIAILREDNIHLIEPLITDWDE